MGGGSHPPIPDWKQYKVEGIKELEWVQKSLAAKGLKDPWLRNEVWRYRQWPGFGKSFQIIVGRGFKWAAAAMVLTIGVDTMFGISKSKHAHDHDAGHHH